MRTLRTIFQVAVSLMTIGAGANGQRPMSDSEYTQKAISAAPEAVRQDATVIREDRDGSMRTLHPGNNGFTCMIIGPDAMCNDANSTEFFEAMMKHEPPPDKIGISYMLRGDDGASNTDPYATGKTADNHWIVTGPHILITGTAAKTLGSPRRRTPIPVSPT